VILDNLSAHKGPTIRRWAKRNKVELCFTPTYSSWANPIEAHFGPLREFVLNNSNHPNHVVLTRRLHAHLRWRNANARAPELLAAQRRERARVRAEKAADGEGPSHEPPDRRPARTFLVRALATVTASAQCPAPMPLRRPTPMLAGRRRPSGAQGSRGRACATGSPRLG
jgi:hypothetical protein